MSCSSGGIFCWFCILDPVLESVDSSDDKVQEAGPGLFKGKLSVRLLYLKWKHVLQILFFLSICSTLACLIEKTSTLLSLD